MYDNIRFHLDEDYPDQLPPENAATHIGMYWQWAAQAGLVNPVWQTAPETAADFAAMTAGKISGRHFLLKHMDGALTADDFTELGQRFTEFYSPTKKTATAHLWKTTSSPSTRPRSAASITSKTPRKPSPN